MKFVIKTLSNNYQSECRNLEKQQKELESKISNDATVTWGSAFDLWILCEERIRLTQSLRKLASVTMPRFTILPIKTKPMPQFKKKCVSSRSWPPDKTVCDDIEICFPGEHFVPMKKSYVMQPHLSHFWPEVCCDAKEAIKTMSSMCIMCLEESEQFYQA